MEKDNDSLNEGKSGFNKETSYTMFAGLIPLPFVAQLDTVYDLSPPLTRSLISWMASARRRQLVDKPLESLL